MRSQHLERATRNNYDLVVIGGGIYGACLTLEAARRGIRTLLLEKEDFGGATSWNSLRIAHGGLRYLQTLDFARCYRSALEQAWWLQNFPELLTPMQCLMPLYGLGLRRSSVMRPALQLNDLLAGYARRSLTGDQAMIPRSRVISPQATVELFRDVDCEGLRGGALWHDVRMRSPQRLLIEVLRWATACGAEVINYAEAKELDVHRNRVRGLTALCQSSHQITTFQTSRVVNCAGPWMQQLASQFDCQCPSLFSPALAFNVLLDRRPLSPAALAIKPKVRNGHTYFLVPDGERIMAGTIHAPWTVPVGEGPLSPDPEQVETLCRDLNGSVPSLRLGRQDVECVFAGLLPASSKGVATPAKKPRIYDHGRHGGPQGLVSVSGVKYTTARAIAEKTLRLLNVCNDRPLPPYNTTPRPTCTTSLDLTVFPESVCIHGDELARGLQSVIDDQWVVRLDDLLLRRTDWCRNPQQVARLASRVTDALGDTSDLLPLPLREG